MKRRRVAWTWLLLAGLAGCEKLKSPEPPIPLPRMDPPSAAQATLGAAVRRQLLGFSLL